MAGFLSAEKSLVRFAEDTLGNGCARVLLNTSNYVYHQDDEYDMIQDGIGIVEDYDDWEGNEDNCSSMMDDEYNRFIWLVKEGEEICGRIQLRQKLHFGWRYVMQNGK